jgi:hypothetical protein
MIPRARSLVPLILALPFLGGAGVCGVVLVDIAQRELVLDPVTEIAFDVESGSIEVYAFDRNGVVLLDHMVGSLHDIGDSFHEVVEERLEVISECDHSEFCTVDWYAEVPATTAVDVRTRTGDVKLTGVSQPIVAEIAEGALEGANLRTATLRATVDRGEVDLELLAAFEAVVIEVGEGDVTLTLPPGEYRCELAAPDGEIGAEGITCDPMAAALIEVTALSGDVRLIPGDPP